MENSRLYKRIENNYGFRLSCAEKMLLRNYVDWTNQTDITMPSVVSRRFLEDFGFECETFKEDIKEREKHLQEIISEYEFRGKQRTKK